MNHGKITGQSRGYLFKKIYEFYAHHRATENTENIFVGMIFERKNQTKLYSLTRIRPRRRNPLTRRGIINFLLFREKRITCYFRKMGLRLLLLQNIFQRTIITLGGVVCIYSSCLKLLTIRDSPDRAFRYYGNDHFHNCYHDFDAQIE